MDGYAVRAVDVTSARPDHPLRLPVTADIPAGPFTGGELEPGAAQRIMTGAMVPPGADAIIPVEDTNPGDRDVEITTSPLAGTHVRRAGADVTAGEVVITAGTAMTAARIGLCAALGIAEITVLQRPRVLVVSTGSELVAAGETLRPGEIYESNAPMLAAALAAAGAEPTIARFTADNADQFRATLDAHLPDTDVIVTSGGVSAGAYEVVKDALTGPDVDFVKVAMQPGKPQGLGRYRGVPLVAFPGNPVSAQVSFEVFLRPALRKLMGVSPATRPTRKAILNEEVRSPAGLRQFRRGILDFESGIVQTIGPPASHFLRWLATANCIVDIDEDITELANPSAVHVWNLED